MIVSFSVAYSVSVRIPALFKFCSSVSCLYNFDRLSISFAGLLVLVLGVGGADFVVPVRADVIADAASANA